MLGNHLKKRRKGIDLSLSQVAARIGVDKSYLSRVESDRVKPSPKVLKKLVKVLGEDPEKIGVLAGHLPKDVQSFVYRHPTEAIGTLRESLSSYAAGNSVEKPIRSLQPYFTTVGGKLFLADCVEFLRGIESRSARVVFADPPYNIKKAEWDSFASQKAYVEWCEKWIAEAHRVLMDDGSLYVCGFSEILADVKWAAGRYFAGCKWLVWYYRNKANLGMDWGRSHESILHLRKTRKVSVRVDRIRIPYNAHTLRYPERPQGASSQYTHAGNGTIPGNGGRTWSPNPLGAKPRDVLEIPTLCNGMAEKTSHPTQKPEELVRKLILASTDTGDLVVDPFGGSGTTFVVAEKLGRKWLGGEISSRYCEEAAGRLKSLAGQQMALLPVEEIEAVARRSRLRWGGR